MISRRELLKGIVAAPVVAVLPTAVVAGEALGEARFIPMLYCARTVILNPGWMCIVEQPTASISSINDPLSFSGNEV